MLSDESNMLTSFQIQVPESESVWLEGSDRLGFTSESHVGIISLSYSERNAIIRDVLNPETGEDDFPEIENSYQFDSISYPIAWSIGVVIKKGNNQKRVTVTYITRIFVMYEWTRHLPQFYHEC